LVEEGVMGALLVAGLAMAGAAIGIAQTAAGARGGTGPNAALVRATAIVGMAFAQGIGILGTVVGLLAITVVDGGDATSGVVEACVAGAGVLVGLAIVARAGDAIDARVRLLGLLYIMGSATLGIVVGVLAALIGSGRVVGSDAIFVILGLIGFGAAIKIGRTAGPALAAMSTTPSDAIDIRRRLIRTATITQSVGTIAMVAAIALLFLGEGGRPA
jgi:F0F1-type ATP synthase membrane subunit c/vacuolar-type H+-ATPase subunit K